MAKNNYTNRGAHSRTICRKRDRLVENLAILRQNFGFDGSRGQPAGRKSAVFEQNLDLDSSGAGPMVQNLAFFGQDFGLHGSGGAGSGKRAAKTHQGSSANTRATRKQYKFSWLLILPRVVEGKQASAAALSARQRLKISKLKISQTQNIQIFWLGGFWA